MIFRKPQTGACYGCVVARQPAETPGKEIDLLEPEREKSAQPCFQIPPVVIRGIAGQLDLQSRFKCDIMMNF